MGVSKITRSGRALKEWEAQAPFPVSEISPDPDFCEARGVQCNVIECFDVTACGEARQLDDKVRY